MLLLMVYTTNLLHAEDGLKKEDCGIRSTVVHALLDPGNEYTKRKGGRSDRVREREEGGREGGRSSEHHISNECCIYHGFNISSASTNSFLFITSMAALAAASPVNISIILSLRERERERDLY